MLACVHLAWTSLLRLVIDLKLPVSFTFPSKIVSEHPPLVGSIKVMPFPASFDILSLPNLATGQSAALDGTNELSLLSKESEANESRIMMKIAALTNAHPKKKIPVRS